MKTVSGACKYCGQIIALEVPESYTREMIDEEATKKCDCPEAETETKRQQAIAYADGAIKDFFKDKDGLESIQNILLQSVEPLAYGRIGKISISGGEYTAMMKPGKSGIKLTLVYATKESIES